MFTVLDKEKLIQHLGTGILKGQPEIIITSKTDSTNEDAKSFLKKQKNDIAIHLSEQQLAGKGRNGKKWISPKGKNIYLSIAWKSPLSYSQLDGLSLSVGTVLAKSLNMYCNDSIKVKWPNDLLANNKKTAGILIETLEIKGTIGVVIGIGINVHMDYEEGKEIDQDWTSVDEISNVISDRNRITADLLNGIYELIEAYPEHGFSYYKKDFENLDLLRNSMCQIEIRNKKEKVKVIGVNNLGELIVEKKGKYLELRYGEVSIREL